MICKFCGAPIYTSVADGTALLFGGVKLLVDVIEYIVSLFKRKRSK
jgi:hypothetical protein